MEMKCSWRTFRFIVISCMTVVECHKSQHLVLSEPRKTGLEGTLLQVNCTAHVTSPLDSLKWIPSHEGQSGIQQSFVTNTTVVMTISSLQGSDAGRYKCLLVMTDGREETAEFELMVRRKEPNSAACSITQFKCKRTKHCIFLRYRCDGKDDCGDGSDEDCEIKPCLNKFRCNNSRCIDNEEVCNHIDNCGDLSDEATICFLGKLSTTQPVTEDNQFGWLKITMSTVIASTVGAVILISFIVIVVFRVKMKRQREQRIARALEGMYRHGESGEATSSGQGDEAPSDQRPFLPSGSHHYGNIIVNVNNGVQYLPGYDYSLFVAVPPPYSECSGGSGGDHKSQPPPYSTIDRNNTRQQTCVAEPCEGQTGRQSISMCTVQNCLAGMRGTEHVGTPGHGTFIGNVHANCGQVYHGQDLESLSGITPRFLQSLLGSHSPDVDGYRTSFQSLPAPVDGWPARSQVSTHILPARVAGDSLSRQAPSTTSSSTQTSQHQSLASCHLNPGADTAVARQGTSVESCDADKLVSNTSIVQHIASIPDGVVTEHDNAVNVHGVSRGIHQIPVGMSRGIHQIPVGMSGFSEYDDTCAAVLNSPCTSSSLAAETTSDFDDLNVPLLGRSQAEITPNLNVPLLCRSQAETTPNLDLDDLNVPLLGNSRAKMTPNLDDLNVPLLGHSQAEKSLADRTCLVKISGDISNSDTTTADGTSDSDGTSDCLLFSATDTTPHCIAFVNEVSYESRENQPRSGQVGGQNVILTDGYLPAGSSAVSVPAAGSITSAGHRAPVFGTSTVIDENSSRLVSCVPDDWAHVAPKNAENQSQLLLNEGSCCDTPAADTQSFQQSSTNQPVSSSFGVDANITDSASCNTAENKHRCSGELNVQDGNLVLEASRHIASSCLHDMYASEQQDMARVSHDSMQPVVNTKRPAGVVTRPALPTFNSDLVLPYRNQPL